MSNLRELYEFRTGESVFRYTTRGDDILYNGFVWSSTALRRNRITQGPEASQNGLEITFPLGHPFAMQYLGYGPDAETKVTVFRTSPQDDNTFFTAFKGHVADCEADSDEVTLVCENVLARAQGAGLRARMQKFCRHAIFDHDCGVDENEFAVATVPTEIDTRLVTVTCPEAAGQPDGWFSGGMLRVPSGALRYIVKHVGDQISLWRPEPGILDMINNAGYGNSWGQYWGGVGLTLYPGCDGSLNACKDKFDNLDQNGAFYWIPDINPTGGNSVF